MKPNKITNYNPPESKVISIKDKSTLNANEKSVKSKIILPVLDGFEFVHIRTIKYMQADGAYVKLFLAGGKKLTVAKTLKEMVSKVPSNYFLRVHQSFLVNVEFISKYNKKNASLVLDGGEKVNVSRSGSQRLKEYILTYS